MLDEDVYCDRGAAVDARWTSIWTKWTSAEQRQHFANVATWGPLTIGQCQQLIQDLPPAPYGWSDPSTCLAPFVATVRRLRKDMERGAFPTNPTPVEFAAWCNQMSVVLPADFVDALPKAVNAVVTGNATSPAQAQSAFPGWAAMPPPKASPKPKKPSRGRPPSASIHHASVIRRADQILLKHARAGRSQTLPEVARQTYHDTVGGGMTEASILRLINGKLSIAVAKATVAKFRAKAAKAKKAAKAANRA